MKGIGTTACPVLSDVCWEYLERVTTWIVDNEDAVTTYVCMHPTASPVCMRVYLRVEQCRFVGAVICVSVSRLRCPCARGDIGCRQLPGFAWEHSVHAIKWRWCYQETSV
eukprot:GHVU01178904.1.p4 GENE.GHVU01178904.1~~GHVU01178904.1.p4  ORF type:complete len:110 (-),score=1.29 GHVU01178904.1:212-541(-)